MRTRFVILISLFLLMILPACNLVRETETATPQPTQEVGGAPTVTINSPQDGEQVLRDRELLVSATTSDQVGVTRVQLFANDQPVRTIVSEVEGGEEVKNVVLNYTPIRTGQLKLSVIAYRGPIASQPAVINVDVVNNVTDITQVPGQPTATTGIDPGDPTCRALINTGLNLRAGPSVEYQVLTVIPAGELVPVIGRLGDNTWWQVNYRTIIGWVSASYTTIYGTNCTFVPIVQPPASPTPNVTATFTPTWTPPATLTPTVAFTDTPGIADLTITTLSGAESVTIPADQDSITERYSVTVTNQGTDRTGQFSMELRVIPNGPSTQVGVGNLRPGEAASFQLDLTFSTPGNFTLVAEADINNEVSESNKTNNVSSRPLAITKAE